jgi:hypothetical protein
MLLMSSSFFAFKVTAERWRVQYVGGRRLTFKYAPFGDVRSLNGSLWVASLIDCLCYVGVYPKTKLPELWTKSPEGANLNNPGGYPGGSDNSRFRFPEGANKDLFIAYLYKRLTSCQMV